MRLVFSPFSHGISHTELPTLRSIAIMVNVPRQNISYYDLQNNLCHLHHPSGRSEYGFVSVKKPLHLL